MFPSLIIWDFNGTLLDDTGVILNINNRMNRSRNIPEITMEYFKEHFDYPPQKYYEMLGYNFEAETYNQVSSEFLLYYMEMNRQISLTPNAKETLDWIKRQNIPQILLSAHIQNHLLQQLKQLDIWNYFEFISGEKNDIVIGKVQRGQMLAQTLPYDFSNGVLIGDTTHDYRAAQAIGCQCILYSGGQQSSKRLHKVCKYVIESLEEIPNMLKKIELEKGD